MENNEKTQPTSSSGKSADFKKESFDRLDFEERIKGLVEKGRRRGRRYSLIGIIASVIICAVVLASGYFLIKQINSFIKKAEESVNKASEMGTKSLAKPTLFAAWKNCETDNDCLETQKGCCACNMGGEQTAINVNFFDKWDAERNKKCSDIMCIALYNCREGKITCWNKKCVFEIANSE